MDNVFQPIKIRAAETKNLFIQICWEWLRDMKTLQSNTVWNDLVFAKWYAPHSLPRRLGIALRAKENVNNDATNLLPDRYRKYWKNHPEFFHIVFNADVPNLILPPPPYELPFFTINNPYPTIQNTIMEGIEFFINLFEM